MKSVNIAKFKAELSKYLGYVRKGEEVFVYDRKESLAKVIPLNKHDLAKIIIEEPQKKANDIFLIKAKTVANIKIDSLKFLLEERGER